MEAFFLVLKQFESFFRRSLMPSSVLILLLFLFEPIEDIFNKYLNKYNFFTKVENNQILLIFSIIVGLITISFFMSILMQLIFDNQMKKNFNSLFFYSNENNILDKLRLEVIEKLKKENDKMFIDIEKNDYFLYILISSKLNLLKQPQHYITRYIDDIKSAGIVLLSIIFVIIIDFFINFNMSWNFICYTPLYIFLSLLFWYIGWEYIKSKYRSRAFKLYINYLLS